MKTIAITNQKGGTAKTTLTAALGVLLSRRGIPVHLIDMDPQADLTAAFGIDGTNSQLFNRLDSETELEVVNVADSLTISPSNLQLLRAETEFLSRPSREFVLRSALAKTKLTDDSIVLIDCPPSLGVLSVASLVAADGLCVVVQPGGFELQTLVHLGQTADLLRQYVNPNLQSPSNLWSALTCNDRVMPPRRPPPAPSLSPSLRRFASRRSLRVCELLFLPLGWVCSWARDPPQGQKMQGGLFGKFVGNHDTC